MASDECGGGNCFWEWTALCRELDPWLAANLSACEHHRRHSDCSSGSRFDSIFCAQTCCQSGPSSRCGECAVRPARVSGAVHLFDGRRFGGWLDGTGDLSGDDGGPDAIHPGRELRESALARMVDGPDNQRGALMASPHATHEEIAAARRALFPADEPWHCGALPAPAGRELSPDLFQGPRGCRWTARALLRTK